MADKLSWGEIKRQYPDEFVVIIEPDVDEATTTLLGGTVVNHGKDKADMIRYLGTLDARDGACRWTGKIHGRVQAVVKNEDR